MEEPFREEDLLLVPARERRRPGTADVDARTSTRCDQLVDAAALRSRQDDTGAARPGSRCGRVTFSTIERALEALVLARLRAASRCPARIASRGERIVSSLAVEARPSPLSRRSAPKIARATSVRPAPTRPASPTISPARTSNEMSSNDRPPREPAHRETTGRRRAGRPCPGRSSPSGGPSIAVTTRRRGLRRSRRRADQAPVPQHRHRVRDREHLRQEVRDVHDRRARPRAGRGRSRAGVCASSAGQRRRRLVHDDRALRRARAPAGSRPSAGPRCASVADGAVGGQVEPRPLVRARRSAARMRRRSTTTVRAARLVARGRRSRARCAAGTSVISCAIIVTP